MNSVVFSIEEAIPSNELTTYENVRRNQEAGTVNVYTGRASMLDLLTFVN